MTTPYYGDELVTLWHGDCLDVMRSMADESVHAIVTDPPYGLGFMGKAWDDLPPGLDFAVEAFRVLKPGGHILAFGGTRTWHRLAVAVEDAGFEIRDSIAWLYGSGFPKSLDVSKAIDKAAGAERPLTRIGSVQRGGLGEDWDTGSSDSRPRYDAPATDAAREWQGWGTALKPAFEPIVVGRKPLIGTVAQNVLAHGTGALNIDGCRVGDANTRRVSNADTNGKGWGMGASAHLNGSVSGRFPANVILDESQAAALDKESGVLHPPGTRSNRGDRSPFANGASSLESCADVINDHGGASRFFPTFHYEAKAPTSERPRAGELAHPTVKPLDLMRWLVRLVTPPGGTILEPFAGSGTTLEAALIEGFHIIGIEREEAYLPLIMQRIRKPLQQSLFGDIA